MRAHGGRGADRRVRSGGRGSACDAAATAAVGGYGWAVGPVRTPPAAGLATWRGWVWQGASPPGTWQNFASG